MARVLLVDDEVVRVPMRKILTLAGHEILEAWDGQAAWELYCSQPADIVVTDIHLPRMDGLELTERLRRRSPGVKIIVTGAQGDELFATATELGADATLEKPFSMKRLVHVVGELLSEH